MVFMCLDHTREFFGDLRVAPEDLETTTPVLFATRWITHFCAPTFVFLAGVSAWLYQKRANSKRDLSQFLWTRGLWLIFLEFTVVYFGWFFSFGTLPLMFIVIAAIGFCMIALSLLVWLPVHILLVFGLAIVFLHNTLDSIQAESLGSFSWAWILLHEPGRIAWLDMDVGYPVLPWIGVIVCGYCFGQILDLNAARRRSYCLWIGIGCTMLFVALRLWNGYGDPVPRDSYDQLPRTIMSFLRCTKYPPSLLYLLMTLGPALIVLAVFDASEQQRKKLQCFLPLLSVFGRVPLFFYVTHLYLINACSMLLYGIVRGEAISPVATAFHCFQSNTEFPATYGFPLWVVYPAWVTMLLVLWPLCRWYGSFKRAKKHPVWSYL